MSTLKKHRKSRQKDYRTNVTFSKTLDKNFERSHFFVSWYDSTMVHLSKNLVMVSMVAKM